MPAASATTVNRVDAGLRASSRSPWLRSRTTLSEIITAQTSGTPDYFRLARGVGYDSHHEDAHCPLYPAQHITTAGATSAGGSSCNMLRRVKRAVGIFMVTIVSYAARRPEIIGRAARLGCNDLRERCTRPEPRTAAAGPQSRVYPVGGSRAGGRHRDQYGGLHRLQGDGGAAAGRARPVDHGEPGAEARARQRAVVIQLSGL